MEFDRIGWGLFNVDEPVLIQVGAMKDDLQKTIVSHSFTPKKFYVLDIRRVENHKYIESMHQIDCFYDGINNFVRNHWIHDDRGISFRLKPDWRYGRDVRIYGFDDQNNPDLWQMIGWKRGFQVTSNAVMKIGIPKEAKIIHPNNSNKLRTDKIHIIEIHLGDPRYFEDGSSIPWCNNYFKANGKRNKYIVNERYDADWLDEDSDEQCAHGIHFVENYQDLNGVFSQGESVKDSEGNPWFISAGKSPKWEVPRIIRGL